jgi:hypothetical protein
MHKQKECQGNRHIQEEQAGIEPDIPMPSAFTFGFLSQYRDFPYAEERNDNG